MTLSPLHLAIVSSRARESFPELPGFTPNFVPLNLIKRRNKSKQPLSAHWKWRGPGAISVLVCGGGLRMLMTGQVPSGSPPPLGDRTDPLHLSAVEKALSASWPESHLPEESRSPRPSPSSQDRAVHSFSDLGIGISLTGDFRRERCILCGRSCLPECDVYAVCLAGVTFKSVV